MSLYFYFSDMKFSTIIFLFLSTFCFSQEIDCPVENGVIYYKEYSEYVTMKMCYLGTPSKSTNIHSETSFLVKSVSDGKIVSIIRTDNLSSVLVRKGDEFYVYGYLSSINVKKGDEVKIGDKIGIIDKKNEFSGDGDYVLDFQYWQKTELIDVFDRLKCIKK